VVLSFGFDEEGGGYHVRLQSERVHYLPLTQVQGAGELGKVLLDRFGPDSFAMIVDEGCGLSSMVSTRN
jgi:hypothetical protein